jgi:hypothetical protein
MPDLSMIPSHIILVGAVVELVGVEDPKVGCSTEDDALVHTRVKGW